MTNEFKFYDEWLPEGFGFSRENPWKAAHDRQEEYPRTDADAQAEENATQAEVDAALRAIFEPPADDGRPHSIDK